MTSLMNNYGTRISSRFPKGEGCLLFSENGEKYLDFLSGIAVNALGHNHPKIIDAIYCAAKKPIHLSNFFEIPEQESLAKKLIQLAGGGYKACFGNSGAEANEAALKIARKSTGRKKFISFTGGFHGRTFGALSVTPRADIQEGFKPLVPECDTLRYNDISDIETIDDSVAAVILECIQGEGGVIPAKKEWIQALFEKCQKEGVLFIVDEVQTGAGRTGTFFSYEQYDISPDIITLAKGVGGGVPIGIMLAKDSIAEAFSPGSHGSTFSGNPFICTIAKAVVDEVSKPDFLESVREKSKYFLEKLTTLQQLFPQKIKNIRTAGLLIGIELSEEYDAQQIYSGFLENNILANRTQKTVIRAIPPLIVSREEIDQFCEVLGVLLKR